MPMKKRLTAKDKAERRGANALSKFQWLILYAAKEYTIPGRNETDDLRQEGLIELAMMLQDFPDWDPVDTVDFEKMFKTRLWHRMVDLARMARTTKRNGMREVSLDDPASVAHKVVMAVTDPEQGHASADLQIVGKDLYSKIRAELDDDQRAVLALLVHPNERFMEYCAGGDSTKLDRIRDYLELEEKEIRYHMKRIQQVTSNLQSDFQAESIHSVVHILALPSTYSEVPYWCVWENLDMMCRRLFSLLVFSDLPTNVSLTRLCNLLHQPKSDVISLLQKIAAAVKRLHDDGVRIPDPDRISTSCAPGREKGCEEKARYTCWETGLRGCDKHLAHCKFNPTHRFLPTMRQAHENWCAAHPLKHSRTCESSPKCVSKAVARCFDTGVRGCDKHLGKCRYNPAHRFIKSCKTTHEAWCKQHPEMH